MKDHRPHLELFDGGPPERLWTSDPAHRKVDFSGLLSPEDSIIAVAKGARPSALLAGLEHRATVVGGLTALHAAAVPGFEHTDVRRLKVLKGSHADAAILRAAHQKGSGPAAMAEAARRVVATVHRHQLDRAAWGYRGLLLLGATKGFVVAHTAAATVIGLVPGVGTLVGAGLGAELAVSQAMAKREAVKFQQMTREVLASRGIPDETGAPVTPQPADTGGGPSLLTIGLGLGALGGLWAWSRQ